MRAAIFMLVYGFCFLWGFFFAEFTMGGEHLNSAVGKGMKTKLSKIKD